MMTSRDILSVALAVGVTIAAAFSLACGGSSTEPKTPPPETTGQKKGSLATPKASSSAADSVKASKPVECGDKFCEAGQECKGGYCVSGSSSSGDGLNSMLGDDAVSPQQPKSAIGIAASKDLGQLTDDEITFFKQGVQKLQASCDAGDQEACDNLQKISKELKMACLGQKPRACQLKKGLGF